MSEARLDQLLSMRLGCTRSQAERLIREGRVTVNGVPASKPGQKVSEVCDIQADLPEPQPLNAQPQDLPLDILYQDADLAVVVKPRGMVVHPAAGNPDGTLVNALLFHLEDLSGIGGALRPGIVHRLDKDTTGLLLVAKNDRAHQLLSDALKERRIQKTYHAVVHGHLPEAGGIIEKPIGRDPKDRKKMAVTADGRWARTEYQVLEFLRGATLAEVHIITGRTHQIRVHMHSIGHSLLGDSLYANAKMQPNSSVLLLHAFRIEFEHPITGQHMIFEAPEPEDFRREVEKLRLK